MIRLVLTAVALLWAGGSPGLASAAELPPTDPRCVVGGEALSRLIARERTGGLVFNKAPISKLAVRPGQPLSGTGGAVSAQLAAAWTRAPQSNLLHDCPSLRKRLPAGWRFATEEEVASPQRPRILLIGTPVLHGSEALVQVGSICAGLCGAYTVDLYRRQRGQWRHEAIATLALS